MYYLYVHTVPNGKMYIGMSTRIEERWQNGRGYANNKEFINDIEIFGWENIKHEIIDCFENEEKCHMYEMIYSILLNTEDSCNGYNKTNFLEYFMHKFNQKRPYDEYDEIEPADSSDKNIFELYDLSYNDGKNLIDQWILNEKHRQITKDKLLNGLSYSEMSKKYNLSITQLKRICYRCTEKLQKHI